MGFCSVASMEMWITGNYYHCGPQTHIDMLLGGREDKQMQALSSVFVV